MYKFHGIWHSRQTPINPIRLLMKNPNIKQLPKCGKNAKTLKLEIGTQFLQPCTTNTKSRFTAILQGVPKYYISIFNLKTGTIDNYPSFLEPDMMNICSLLIVSENWKTKCYRLLYKILITHKTGIIFYQKKVLCHKAQLKIIAMDNHMI